MVSSELLNLLLPNLVWWCIIISSKKIGLLSSRLKSQWRIIESRYDFLTCLLNCWSFCNWTWCDGISSQAGLSYEGYGLLCCGQGQGHRKGSKFLWMLIRTISLPLLNLLKPYLVWWCITMGRCLQVQGHIEGSYNQIWLCLLYLLNCWSLFNHIYLDGTLKAGVFCVNLDYSFQDQDHSTGSKLYWIFM